MMEQQPSPADSCFAPLSIDLVGRVVATTVLHPFVCWLVPLCLRARAVSYHAAEMRVAVAWATLVTLGWAVAALDRRIAHPEPNPHLRSHAAPPPVDADNDADDTDPVVVVTGGASGLGLLVAEMLGMRGAAVAVLDVREPDHGPSPGLTFYRCDVSDRAQLLRAAAQIERDLGTPTVLVNNAAVVVGKPLLAMTDAELDGSVATNFLAHFYALRAFVPAMVARGRGTFVTVSSVMGAVGAARLSDYAAAKAGVSALHRSMAAELARAAPGVRAVLVEAGQLSTPLFYGVRTPSAFFAPVVPPVELAREIVAAVEAGRGGVITMPLYARWIHWLAVLPPSLQLLLRRLAGVDTAMDSFAGREAWARDAAVTAAGRKKDLINS